MPIYILDKTFVLETKNSHYVFSIDEQGYSHHLHFGRKCSVDDYCYYKAPFENTNHTKRDMFTEEFSFFGGTMYRECDLKVKYFDNCREADLHYDSYSVSDSTLKVVFKDKHYGLKLSLIYEIFNDFDIIKRYSKLENESKFDTEIERFYSAQFNLPDESPYKFKNTNGAWGAEFLETETTLEGGCLVFESRRGATGHNTSPYFIAHQNANEESADVFFASLLYSGSFKVVASRDVFCKTRVSLGINDFDFKYVLKSGESLESPAVIAGFTKGFGNMSREINKFSISHILPKSFSKKELPILYNSWEATNFDVNTKGQSTLAEIAASIGAELFVMDDGWFGKRNDDTKALGDWYVNREKFPNGLSQLIENVNNLGLDFGIWIEPEMVCPDSDLFRAHPEYAYHYNTRQANTIRHQLVLNLTREDVQEYVYNSIDYLLSKYNIKYIKWDMNRPFSETGAENLSCPQALWYLHTKAVYDIVDKLKEKHQSVQFETCSSGGGRCDLGALSHFDQAWTSDNTDAIDRMTIQKGYSLMRPVKTMRAWVTDTVGYNKQTSLDFRFNIAMQGSLGLGGDLTTYSKEELEICRKNIALYKEIRSIVQFGNLYRILDFDKDEILFNLYVNDEKTQAVGFIAARGTRFYRKSINLKFKGLCENKRYEFTFDNEKYEKSGAYLSSVGVAAKIIGDNYSRIIRIFAK